MKKTAYLLAVTLLLISLSGCGYKDTIAELEVEVETLQSDNNTLNEELSGVQQEAALLESSLDELLSATPEPTPEPFTVSLGVTPDALNENIIYLIENTFTTLDPLPAAEEGISANGNATLRYQLGKNTYMEYTLNIYGEVQSVEVSYDFKRKSDKEEGQFGNYNALVVTAYVMALESPLDYSGSIAFKTTDIITTGTYREGSIIMTTGSFPNQLVMRLYAEFN